MMIGVKDDTNEWHSGEPIFRVRKIVEADEADETAEVNSTEIAS